MLLILMNLGFAGGTPVASLPAFYWAATNTVIGTTWDSGDTLWDLDGNVINTYWDESDPVFAQSSSNNTIWFTQ